jgi:putative endonuclease
MVHGGTVYMMTNKLRTVLYTGVTSDLRGRIVQHKTHFFPKSFTAKYNCTICVYFEHFSRIEEAIAREKEIKGWNRVRKNELVSAMNPDWTDLWPEIENW